MHASTAKGHMVCQSGTWCPDQPALRCVSSYRLRGAISIADDSVACRTGWEYRRYCAAPTGLQFLIAGRRPFEKEIPGRLSAIASCLAASLDCRLQERTTPRPRCPPPWRRNALHANAWIALVSDIQDTYVLLSERELTVTKDGRHQAGPVAGAGQGRSSRRSRSPSLQALNEKSPGTNPGLLPLR